MNISTICPGSSGYIVIGDNCYPVLDMVVKSCIGECTTFSGRFFPGELFSRDEVARVGRSLEIQNVIFNDPATVVIWSDGSKTVVKCQPGDTYSKETGLALCIAKKFLGNKGNFNEVFKQWIPEDTEPVEEISVDEMRKALDEFCYGKRCSKCPLDVPVCRCGCGTHFLNREYGRYEMSDDEIRAAYKVAFKEG